MQLVGVTASARLGLARLADEMSAVVAGDKTGHTPALLRATQDRYDRLASDLVDTSINDLGIAFKLAIKLQLKTQGLSIALKTLQAQFDRERLRVKRLLRNVKDADRKNLFERIVHARGRALAAAAAEKRRLEIGDGMVQASVGFDEAVAKLGEDWRASRSTHSFFLSLMLTSYALQRPLPTRSRRRRFAISSSALRSEPRSTRPWSVAVECGTTVSLPAVPKRDSLWISS